MNPVTEISLDEDSFMEMKQSRSEAWIRQRGKTEAHLKAGAKLVVMERLMTHGKQKAESWFDVQLDGEDSSANIVCPALWQEMNPGSCSSPTSAEIPDAADTRNVMPLFAKCK